MMRSARASLGIKSGVQIFPVNDTDRKIAALDKEIHYNGPVIRDFSNKLTRAKLEYDLATEAFKKEIIKRPRNNDSYEEAKSKRDAVIQEINETLEQLDMEVEKHKESFGKSLERQSLIAQRRDEAVMGRGVTRRRRKYKKHKKSLRLKKHKKSLRLKKHKKSLKH